MKTYIFLGGPQELWPENILSEVKELRQETNKIKVIGVDHGNLLLLNAGVVPDIAVGDYDSLHGDERKRLEASVADIRYAIPEKDFTDSEMGLRVALDDLKSTEIMVIGATGGRLDHFLVNLFCVLKPELRPSLRKIYFQDRQNLIEFYGPGQHVINEIAAYKYLAFVNLTAVTGFTIFDAKYPLADFKSDYPVSWASNEFVRAQIHFELTSGVLAVIYSKD